MSHFSLDLHVGSLFDEDTNPLIVIVRNGVDSFLHRGIIPRTRLVHRYGGLRNLAIGTRFMWIRCIGNGQENHHQVKDKFERRHHETALCSLALPTSLIADEQKLKMATYPSQIESKRRMFISSERQLAKFTAGEFLLIFYQIRRTPTPKCLILCLNLVLLSSNPNGICYLNLPLWTK